MLIREIFSLLIRKKRTQKSRRQRKMEILKRQTWKLSSLSCSTVSPAWSTLCCRACAFCTFEKYAFLFAPMLSRCTGVLKESGPASFFMKCYLLVFKMSFFLPVQIGPHHEISLFHFRRFYIGMLEAQSLLNQC